MITNIKKLTGERKDNSIDKKISTAVAILFLVQAINYTIKDALSIPSHLWQPISYAGFTVAGIVVLSVISKVLKRKFQLFIIVEMVAVVIYLLSLVRNMNNNDMIFERAFWTIGVCIPLGVFVAAIKDKTIFYNTMLKATYIITILGMIVFLLNYGEGIRHYSMSFSYLLLLPCIFHANEIFRTHKKYFVVLTISELLLLLFYGARGPVACAGVFIFLKVIFDTNLSVKKILTLVVGTGMFAMFLVFFNQIGNIILNILYSRGYYSRTLTLLFSQEISNSIGRDSIYKTSIEMINEKAIWGWGVAAEQGFMGTYPHNIVLELFLGFGVIVGLPISLYLIYCTIKTFQIINKTTRELSIIYLCAGFVPLFISSTYLESYIFFIFLFIVIPAKSHILTKSSSSAKQLIKQQHIKGVLSMYKNIIS